MADPRVLARSAVAAGVALALLAACGDSSEEASTGFSTGEELHAALATNGIDCGGYLAYRPGTFILGDAADGGRCNYEGETWVLLIGKDAAAAKTRAVSAAQAQPTVYGDNWLVIVGEDQAKVGELITTAIGGELLDAS